MHIHHTSGFSIIKKQVTTTFRLPLNRDINQIPRTSSQSCGHEEEEREGLTGSLIEFRAMQDFDVAQNITSKRESATEVQSIEHSFEIW